MGHQLLLEMELKAASEEVNVQQTFYDFIAFSGNMRCMTRVVPVLYGDFEHSVGFGARPLAQGCVCVGSPVDMVLPVQHDEAFPQMPGEHEGAHLLGPPAPVYCDLIAYCSSSFSEPWKVTNLFFFFKL